MTDPRIVDYLKNGISQGHAPESLRKALLSQGWNNVQVDEAMRMVQGNHMQPGQKPIHRLSDGKSKSGQPGKRTLPITIICLLGFLVSALMIAGGLLLVFMGTLIGGIIGGTELAFFTMILSIMPLINGILGMLGFFMLFKMKKIGWIIVTVIGIISIILSLLMFDITSILSISVWGAILAYIFIKRDLFA